jgi:hypothetical protein
MGLTEVPSELFRMKNLKRVDLSVNNLCSLPSEIALLAMLEVLYVRRLERLDRVPDDCHVVFRSTATNSRLFRPSSVC